MLGWIDRWAIALLSGTIAAELVQALLQPDPYVRAFALPVLVICSIALGSRLQARTMQESEEMVRSYVEAAVERFPHQMTIERNDDGTATAFITRKNGDPVVITIPEEIVAMGPQAATNWIVHELMTEPDVDEE